MADLIPERPITVSEAPRVNLTSSEIAGPYNDLSRVMEKSGEAAETVASSLAKQAGLRAVTRDADGNVQIAQAPIIGPAAEHYAAAVKIAAVAEGEGVARREDIKLRTQFRDNPEGYLAAAEGYTKSIEDQYTKQGGKELGITMRRLIEPITTQTYKGLLNEKERLDLHRATESIDSGIETAKNDMYAMANGGVTSGRPWDLAQDKLNTLYDQKIGNPRLAYPQDKADREMSEFKSELRARSLDYHLTEVQKRDGYEAALEAAKSIRTDRSLNLPPNMRDAYYHRMVAGINDRARDDARVQKGVSSEIDSVGKMALDGYAPSPDRIAKLRTAVAETKSPGLAADLDKTELIATQMKYWRTMSPPQLEASLTDLDKTMREKGGATEDALALKDAGEKLLKTMRTQVGADPLGWADRTGVVQVPPIQFGSEDAAGQMTDRASRAEIVAQHYGVQPTYLRPDEKDALQVATAKGGPEMIAVSRALVDGFGERAPKVMAELSHDAPALAHIGALSLSGGNQGFALDVAEAVKMRADKDFKLPQWMNKPSDTIMAAQGASTRDTYGAAWALLPDGGRAAQTAAQDAFFARAVRNGYDPALGDGRALPGVAGSGPSKGAYERALQESAGARFVGRDQFGGVGTYDAKGFYGFRTFDKVLVPPNVRSDRFADVIGAITDEDLKVRVGVSPMRSDTEPYSAADLRAATPVKVKGGYAFAQGNPTSEDPKFIRGALGSPFVLDFDKLEPELRKRIPGAFLGGR